jgi:[ribosomal protein S18]-alanine N-acetyltransferase
MENESILSSVIIRQYRDDDYEAIVHLWKVTGMGNPARGDSKETIRRTIESGGCLLVMEEKTAGTICGTSWMTTDGRRIMLHHFGILPEFQGKGLSNILLDKSLKFVKKKGLQVKLEVHSNNLKAINLYRKFGFEYLGEYNVYIIRDVSKL